MKVLMDTHALLWAGLEPWKLPPATLELLEDLGTEVFVSAASAWEIATKVRIGKLPGAGSFAQEFPMRLETLGFQQLSVSVEHGQRAGLLPGSHKDPFDRMLMAQAISENMPIVSNERVFDEYHVRRIW
jgi:PIN domain nuclease of toxin-antitoxin system